MTYSVNDIMRDVVASAAEGYGSNITFRFGDWEYVADMLTQWSKSQQTAKLKFPIVVLYSPFEERRSQADRTTATLEMAILVNTSKDYSNEQREQQSFVKVLRPIYDALMGAMKAEPRIVKPYNGFPAHTYRENYRYGRYGVVGSGNEPFRDYVDVIEITNLELTFKEICNGLL